MPSLSWWRFTRTPDEIKTHGIILGVRVTVWHDCGAGVELWKVPGHKAWAGNGGCPWRYVPAEILAVRIADGRFCILEDDIKPPRSRAAKDVLIAKWSATGDRDA